MSRVLIAGMGAVGSALAVRLARAGHEVFGTSRSGAPSSRAPAIEVVACDFTRPIGAEALPPDVDVMFFTAAPDDSDERSYRAVYVDGLRRLVEAIGAQARVIFASSTSVYGETDGSWVDERSPVSPGGFRGRTMLAAEETATSALRLAGLYGPDHMHALDKLRSGEVAVPAERYLNFIHRDDAAAALAHLMSLERPERTYIGVDHEPVTGEAFYGWLAATAGLAPPRWPVSAGRGKRLSSRRLRDSGFSFRYPTFRDGWSPILNGGAGPVLEPCRSARNCVSTVDGDATKRMPALAFRSTAEDAVEVVVAALGSLGGRVLRADDEKVVATFTSAVFRFVDDVEVVVARRGKRIDFRSSSRAGYLDWGVNRRRMEKFTDILASSGDIYILGEPR